jgi:hypothetical protein
MNEPESLCKTQADDSNRALGNHGSMSVPWLGKSLSIPLMMLVEVFSAFQTWWQETKKPA